MRASLLLLALCLGLVAAQDKNTTFTMPAAASTVKVAVASTAAPARGGGGGPSELIVVPSRYGQIVPYSQIVTMATQITCAPGWFPANLRRRDEAELIVALLEAQLHRSRVCGKRGAPELLEVYDYFVTPSPTRRGKGKFVKLSGCFSDAPNEGYLNAQGVVTFRCRGSKSRPTTVGIIADGEMVESFW